ncbi:hypothetical protein ABIE89_006951 [Bradyrhizobium niftali]|uniref:hypothetical protein n=1 Tax=Bradyrhizobium niftali TaxID=2560055 RepID=UPI0038372E78
MFVSSRVDPHSQGLLAARENNFAVTTFKQRDRWSRMIARDPHVKLMHRHVLRSLALCARTDDDGGLAIDPTYDELAKAAACSKSTAIRAVNVAEAIGIVGKKRHSDGRVSNEFELLFPRSNGDKFSVPTVSNLTENKTGNGVTADTVLSLKSKTELEDRVPPITTRESADRRALSDRVFPTAARDVTTPSPDAPSSPAFPTDSAGAECPDTNRETPSGARLNLSKSERGKTTDTSPRGEHFSRYAARDRFGNGPAASNVATITAQCPAPGQRGPYSAPGRSALSRAVTPAPRNGRPVPALGNEARQPEKFR